MMAGTRRTQTLEQRFWPKVDRSAGPDACWPWQASRFVARGGYGQFHDWPRVLAAHRVSYVLANGTIPVGLQVRHSCDNPPCCNPAHLSLGSDAQNKADMVARGRSLTGDRNPSWRKRMAGLTTARYGRYACGHALGKRTAPTCPKCRRMREGKLPPKELAA